MALDWWEQEPRHPLVEKVARAIYEVDPIIGQWDSIRPKDDVYKPWDEARAAIAAIREAEPVSRDELWRAFVAGYRQGSDEDLSGAFDRFLAVGAEPARAENLNRSQPKGAA